MSELKPCPFCGGEDITVEHHSFYTNKKLLSYSCICPTEFSQGYASALDAVKVIIAKLIDGE